MGVMHVEKTMARRGDKGGMFGSGGFFTGVWAKGDAAESEARAKARAAVFAAQNEKSNPCRVPAALSRAVRRQLVVCRLVESVPDALTACSGLPSKTRQAAGRLRKYVRELLQALDAWPEVTGTPGTVRAYRRQVRAVQAVVRDMPEKSGALDTVAYLSAVLALAEDQRAEAGATAEIWGRICRTLGTICTHADPDLDDPRQAAGLETAAGIRKALGAV